MVEVLIRAACFAAVILMGCLLRRVGFFKAEDFDVLARIVTRITLPASIVVSFSGREIDASMLLITLLGFAFGVVYILLACLMNLRASREKRAFELLNFSGYNIGNFTLPFAQSFLGPAGVVTASLFDTGNAVICLGGAYSVAAMVKEGSRFSPLKILKKLLHSMPFCTYFVMIVLALAHLSLPGAVVEFAGILADANAFMAMLMLGVGFQLNGSREQILDIVRILAARYAVAVAAALACYWLVPLDLEYRQALALLVFSPISSVAPAFTAELKSDVGLASAINSVSVLISIVCIVTVLTLVL